MNCHATCAQQQREARAGPRERADRQADPLGARPRPARLRLLRPQRARHARRRLRELPRPRRQDGAWCTRSSRSAWAGASTATAIPRRTCRPLSEITKMDWKPARATRPRSRAKLVAAHHVTPPIALLGVPPMTPKPEVYWRSLDELADTPEFAVRSSARVPRRRLRGAERPVTRRAASCADGRLARLGRPRRLPPARGEDPAVRARRPEEVVPGVPLLLRHHDAVRGQRRRPAGREPRRPADQDRGQRAHPASLGATSAFAQASVLDLYDPDRSQVVLRQGGQRPGMTSWSPRRSLAKLKPRGRRRPSRFARPTARRRCAAAAALSRPNRRLNGAARAVLGAPRVRDSRASFGRSLRTTIWRRQRHRRARQRPSVQRGQRHPAGARVRRRPQAPTRAMNRLYAVESTSSR